MGDAVAAVAAEAAAGMQQVSRGPLLGGRMFRAEGGHDACVTSALSLTPTGRVGPPMPVGWLPSTLIK